MSEQEEPTILAALALPLRVSYSVEEEPRLNLTLTLLNSTRSMTLPRNTAPIWPLVNNITIKDLETGESVALPTVDVQRKTAPQYKLIPEQRDRFITLYPNQPLIESIGFRPFNVSAKEYVPSPGRSKYEMLVLGMHWLDSGKEYSMTFKDELHLREWMAGSTDDLISEPPDEERRWKPTGESLTIKPDLAACRFTVDR